MNINCTCGIKFAPKVIGLNVCPNAKCGKKYTCQTIPNKKVK